MSAVALICLLTIGIVLAESRGYGRPHHEHEHEHEHEQEYGRDYHSGARGHGYHHSSYGYYAEGETYRRLKLESRYNDYQDSQYLLRKVYGEEKNEELYKTDDYSEEHSDEKYGQQEQPVTPEQPGQPGQEQQYEQTQPTYTKIVLDNLVAVEPNDITLEVPGVDETVAHPALLPIVVVDDNPPLEEEGIPVVFIPTTSAPLVPVEDKVPQGLLPIVVDDNPTGLATEDTKVVTAPTVTEDVATADDPIIVVVIINDGTEVPLVDEITQLVQTALDGTGTVTAQEVTEVPAAVPSAGSLAIAVPTVTLPADPVAALEAVNQVVDPTATAAADVATHTTTAYTSGQRRGSKASKASKKH